MAVLAFKVHQVPVMEDHVFLAVVIQVPQEVMVEPEEEVLPQEMVVPLQQEFNRQKLTFL